MDQRIEGTVKWFSNEKGYGFIAPEHGGKDHFCHHSNVEMDGYKSLREGQKVSFIVERGQKGPEAKQIQVIK